MESRLISSLEKVFWDDCVLSFPAHNRGSMLKNERYSFQFVFRLPDAPEARIREWIPRLAGDLAERTSLYLVQHVPLRMPALPGRVDEGYLRTAPGSYPDILQPVAPGKILELGQGLTFSLWLTVDGGEPGDHTLSVWLETPGGEAHGRQDFSLTVINALLPPQTLLYTQWFHCDCLATWYEEDMFSPRHWEIIENYMRAYGKMGHNMILTPVFTPPLDTAPGTYRKTAQLAEVWAENGGWRFHFTQLGRWIALAQDCGITHFEISHFFTQWGAQHAPKVMAWVDGEQKRIFGWDDSASQGEYPRFLQAFLPELLAFLRKTGVDKNCWFHISDEPSLQHAESYAAAKAALGDALDGYPIMDALSNLAFYEKGLVQFPVCANNHIQPFIDAGVPHLWTYYCVSQNVGVSNRFIAQSSSRNRILGAQLFAYDIEGFLQWGYNFYSSYHSREAVNPYVVSDGGFWVPGGDAFSVYPGPDGQPVYSLRELVFYECLQDLRALQLAASLCGKEAVLALVNAGLDTPLRFENPPADARYILSLRERLNALIAASNR